ncbi:MAG: ATP-binding protein [Hyphomicrobiales bacterium]
MLVNFSVENFRSFKNAATLSLESNPAIKEHEENIVSTTVDNIKPLHRVLAMYGVNGAGKSNIFQAILVMRSFVLNSHLNSSDDLIDQDPFLLDTKSSSTPSTFKIKFLLDGIKYDYEYSFQPERVVFEKLIAYPNQIRQIWFERKYSIKKKDYIWKFGPNFKGEKDSIRNRTLENTLFFSKAAQENHELIKPLRTFFLKHLYISQGNESAEHTLHLLQTPEGKEAVVQFLKDAKLGIDDLVLEPKELPEDDLFEFIPDDLKEKIKSLPSMKFTTKSLHRIPNTDDFVSFDFNLQESVGSQKIFKLAGIILRTIKHGGVLFIDEIENNLHLSLIDFIINIFLNPEINKNKAQLIFSTHNPTILEESKIRRDQLWFVIKDEQKSSVLYNLSRISKVDSFPETFKSIRKSQNLLKGYLDGKFYHHKKPDIEVTRQTIQKINQSKQIEFKF